MKNDSSNDNGKRLPSHRLMLQHEADDDRSPQTEVGALWPHKQGGGYSITLRRGIAVQLVEGVRLVAFKIDHEAERERRQQRNDRGGRR